MSGGNGKVVYIDTEGTFRPERICDIAERFGVDRAVVLENITYARAYNHEQQIELLTLVAGKMVSLRGFLTRGGVWFPSSKIRSGIVNEVTINNDRYPSNLTHISFLNFPLLLRTRQRSIIL